MVKKTPVSGSLQKPLNIIQKQLNEALKVMSSCKKLKKCAIKQNWMQQNKKANWINYGRIKQNQWKMRIVQ